MAYFKRLHTEPSQGKDRPRRVLQEGQDVRGRFEKGNRLSKGRGRPPGAVGIKTYADAVAKACTPEVLYQIVERAVTDALGSGKHCDSARIFLFKCLGGDQIRLYLQSEKNPLEYDLERLTDAEMEVLRVLNTKMLVGPPINGETDE